jgi:hypothetical protein
MQVALYVPSGSKAEIAALETFCFHKHRVVGEVLLRLPASVEDRNLPLARCDGFVVSDLSALHRTAVGVMRTVHKILDQGWTLISARDNLVLAPNLMPVLDAILQRPASRYVDRRRPGPQRKTAVDSIKHGPKIAKLLGSGSTVRQASEACGVAPGTVMRVRKMLELGK